MEKVMTFTDDQKALIWSRFVQPAGGTEDEAKHFIEVCETFGLNPLLNDIIFQRYNTKHGPKTQFITTRDGLLRVATHQPGYVGAPNANVVKEGDEFQFNPSKGEVHHKFGQKRGKIIGAYAVMKHAKFNPVAVFVDFYEYFNANSGVVNSRNGTANIWDKMPSAMIVKIAEVFVLRRQFPLGGLYTREEMALENEEDPSPAKVPEEKQTQQPTSEPVKENNSKEKEGTKYISQQQVNELTVVAREISAISNVPENKILNIVGRPVNKIPVSQYEQVKNKFDELLERAKKSPNNNEAEENDKSVSNQNTSDDNSNRSETYTLVKKEEGTSPSGQPFVKLFTKEQNEPIFARNQMVNGVKNLIENESFEAKVVEENGFYFLKTIENMPEAV